LFFLLVANDGAKFSCRLRVAFLSNRTAVVAGDKVGFQNETGD
jgi:hypothetical protein